MTTDDKYTSETTYGCVKVVRNHDYQWGVVDLQDNVIVPFGRYEWIDGFDRGLARVCTKGKLRYTKNIAFIIQDDGPAITNKDEIERMTEQEFCEHPEKFAKWGIINEAGEEVLPLEYDSIWSWQGKTFDTIIAEKNGEKSKIHMEYLNPELAEGYDDANDYYDRDAYSDREFREMTWDAMTDGQYGDMPDGFDGDYDWLGY